jgi:hypothetical protein
MSRLDTEQKLCQGVSLAFVLDEVFGNIWKAELREMSESHETVSGCLE